MTDIQLTYKQQSIRPQPDETVLDCLLREGISVPHGCRAGACQSCAMILDSGGVDDDCQRGLSSAQREQGLFLSCLCHPTESLTFHPPSVEELWRRCRVIDRHWLTTDILRLRLNYSGSWRAGQYVTLSLDGQQSRCFSAANHSGSEAFLELHIRHYRNGVISAALAKTENTKPDILVSRPVGEGYIDPRSERHILCIAQGTGLAPARGFMQQLAMEHSTQAFTLVGLLQAKDESYWQYINAEVADSAWKTQLLLYKDQLPLQNLVEFLKSSVSDWRQQQVYLFGSELFIQQTQKICALQGASRQQIFQEAFLAAPL
ncbi:2Fe-2S iron-sulfur cluster binding domain-containing protein [Spongiibacter sp. KMU-158]|uniref:2Fe-2S iron-sulfur cluster binding domain-containing protein n=1 Tax=Spongiibacter pelagi TaxID=2760804 RepID=A0A927GVK9_9GAMM|nr:2Fe-2S iron-sulfur cluster-binding protein [Spongiibacter pelagi]MBD2858183.1 2Fe-2S iron-sulfur cluster binding domain-containing protein [Spongiibacter pelagi]